MRCSSCEADIPTSARFCHRCAAPIPAAAALPADRLRETLEAAIGFQYKVIRLLGRGGMGAVYLAHELALDREVAIKVLPPDRSETPESRERFRREARTAARLNHTNIVPLYTFGEVSSVVYYVMGYVKGEPLSARMRRAGRLGSEDARRILGEIADSLAYSHAQGVVHRDLKPDNVLIEEATGRALLADFGIAKAIGGGQTLTATGAVVGTPHYMSPEQASGKGEVDGRSDLYSLGVMGYLMLAGRLPFEGKSAGDILVQHMTKEPPPLAPLTDGAPETLVKIVTRCLAKDPAARWPDANALRKALSPDEEEVDLPESLRVMRGVAQAFFVGSLVALWLGVRRKIAGYSFFGGDDSPALVVPIAAALFLPLVAVAVRRDGHSWHSILRSAVLQPTWWRTWYPERFRRPGDVWDRLPRDLRHVRLLVALLLLTSLAVFSDVVYAFRGKQLAGWVVSAALYGRWLWVALFLGTAFQFSKTSKRLRHGSVTLAVDEMWRVLIASTSDRRFWSRPTAAAVLEAPRDVATPAPASIVEIASSLDRLVGQAAPAPREWVERARKAAHTARASFASLDVELRSLEKDHDAALARQIEERLMALGQPNADEPAERSRMRELLAGQADFMRGIASRIDVGKREQARLVDQTNALWQVVEGFRTATADRQAEAAARLTALCEEIERGGAPEQATATRATF